MPSNTSTSSRQIQRHHHYHHHHHDHLAMHSHSVKNIKVAFFLNFGFCILEIYRGSSINERVVSWHLLEDVFGWVAVLIVSITLLFFDIPILDPLLSIVFTLFIVINIVRQLYKTLFIFLQGVPDNISLESITQELTAIEFVHSLHHSHIWTLEGSKNVFTTHIQL